MARLCLEHVTLIVGHAVIIDDIFLCLEKGELYYLIGDHNSGKSVFAAFLRGTYPSSHSSTRILLDGIDISRFDMRQREAIGLRILPQHSEYVFDLTLAENIFLGNEIHNLGVIRWNQIFGNTKAILEKIQWNISPFVLIKNIPKDKLYLISLAKGFISPTKVFVIDETFAFFDFYSENKYRLLSIFSQLKAEGVTILYLAHKMDCVMDIADRVGILKEGRIIQEFDAQHIVKENIVYKLLGESTENLDIPPSLVKKCNLTRREVEIMKLLLEGMNARQISETLYISLSTVKTHIYNIYQKTGVKNRLGLVRLCSLK